MYYLFGVFIVFLLICQLKAADNDTNNSVAFQEIEEDPSRKNKDDRQPVYIPSICGLNELYYPGDQANDWICDCRPAHLYHPKTDTCWPAYQKGPCASGEYLILPKDTVIPMCVKNPCNENHVILSGKCVRLGSTTPCSYLYPVSAAVAVNAVTWEVLCETVNLQNRFGDQATEPLFCKPGSKSYANGKCKTGQK